MMRTLLLAGGSLLCLAGAALAQSADSGTVSATPTNIDKADTKSPISPRLPSPDLGSNATPDQYLVKAKADVEAGSTGAAQEALERSETRLLDRSTAVENANTPDTQPRIEKIHGALAALARNDRNGALKLIDAAMGGSDGAAKMVSVVATPASGLPSTPPQLGGPTQPLNLPIAPGGTSGTTAATATGGTATGDGGAPTAVGGNGSGGGAATATP